MKTIKSYLTTSLTKFLKDSVKNPRNVKFNRKRYLFNKAFGKKEFISYIPSEFDIAITFRCNLRCPACQYLLKDKEAFDKAKDMSLEDFKWILETFQKDIKTVAIQGGEPLLHPEFSKIVRCIRDKKLNLRMSTNGTLIKERIQDLKNLNITMNISLDGTDYQSFKKLRNGTEKQYQDIIEGMGLLRDFQIPFQISFLLFEETLPQISRILDFAREVKPALIRFRSGNPHGSSIWTPLTTESSLVKNFLEEVLSDYSLTLHGSVVAPTFINDKRLFALIQGEINCRNRMAEC